MSKIAIELGGHRLTVFREIKRNKFVDEELPNLNGYYGMTAQKSAVDRRGRRHKLVRFSDLRQHVITQLKIGWSPEQIAGPLQLDGQLLRGGISTWLQQWREVELRQSPAPAPAPRCTGVGPSHKFVKLMLVRIHAMPFNGGQPLLRRLYSCPSALPDISREEVPDRSRCYKQAAAGGL